MTVQRAFLPLALGLFLLACQDRSTTRESATIPEAPKGLQAVAGSSNWRFAMVGDTHVTQSSEVLARELAASIQAEAPSLLLVAGDLAEGGMGATNRRLELQLNNFLKAMAPLTQAGIPVYPVRGNHESDVRGGLTTWRKVFAGLPSNGPSTELGLSYSFSYDNALFIGLDPYADLHRINQAWLDEQLAANTRPHIFVFSHEPAFKARHEDMLGAEPEARNIFWQSLSKAGARTYLCGHDHFLDVSRIDDGDGNAHNDLQQWIVGTGGGGIFDTYKYNGDNGPYSLVPQAHIADYGYLLVEIAGPEVSLSWKRRVVEGGIARYETAYSSRYTVAAASALSSPIVDTDESKCYDTRQVIPAPLPGQPFYGQDAQFEGLKPTYQDNGDGTISDLNTGLMWVQERGNRCTWEEAAVGAALCRVGGHSDWRLPTIKELYSLILFSGAQGPSMTDPAGYIPFLDTRYFGFTYGAGTTSERVIDCQDWSSTLYVGGTMGGQTTAFGVNFADGRIKGYPKGSNTLGKYVRYVRGGSCYGTPDYQDHGNGTITDRAAGLMWAREDSGQGMDWEQALAWVQQMNAVNHLGYSDWRMPNAKELQSLVDYSRGPDASSADKKGAALDPLFSCTAILNEGGMLDYPYFWSSTSFLDGTPNGIPAAYVCFGRALGWMKSPGSNVYVLQDVHGAGAQRSDPKSGKVTDYFLGYDAQGKKVYGRGPQGDVVRIQNFVRLVRNAQ